jgi:hypothetical protein
MELNLRGPVSRQPFGERDIVENENRFRYHSTPLKTVFIFNVESRVGRELRAAQIGWSARRPRRA